VDDLWGGDGRLLLDRLAGTPGPKARLNMVEAFLRTRALRRDTVPPVVAGAAALHLHREFQALAGLTPAQAQREWTVGRHSSNTATDAGR
jgi:hypothetical protein